MKKDILYSALRTPHSALMNQTRAQQLLAQGSTKRLIVLGDLMLDEFIWGEVRRISPEAPVPVVEVKRESWHLGGAGNVVANLLALGAQAMPIGLIGDDAAGLRLRDELTVRAASVAGLVMDSARPTTRKTRIVAHSQQMLRADREDRAPINTALEEKSHQGFRASVANRRRRHHFGLRQRPAHAARPGRDGCGDASARQAGLP